MTDKPEHSPNPDTYDCRQCSDPWPCKVAQLEMLATMTPTELRIGQWTILEQAYPVLEGMPMKDAYDRFLGWAGNPPV